MITTVKQGILAIFAHWERFAKEMAEANNALGDACIEDIRSEIEPVLNPFLMDEQAEGIVSLRDAIFAVFANWAKTMKEQREHSASLNVRECMEKIRLEIEPLLDHFQTPQPLL